MFGPISKAIAGAAAASVGSIATVVAVPAEVNMPWWGYILVGVINGAFGLAVVYIAPRNTGA